MVATRNHKPSSRAACLAGLAFVPPTGTDFLSEGEEADTGQLSFLVTWIVALDDETTPISLTNPLCYCYCTKVLQT